MNRRELLKLGLLGLSTLAFPQVSYAQQTTEEEIPEDVLKAAKSVGVNCVLKSSENRRIATGTILEDILLTAYHVWDYSFRGGDDGLYIGDTRLTCIGTTPKSDIAVFQIPQSAEELHSKYSLKMPKLSIGQKVYAYTPGEKGEGEFRKGIIYGKLQELTDAQNSTYENLVPTTLEVVPGYSGGPVFNQKGEVVGITTHKIVGKNKDSIGGFFSPLTNARYARIKS